MPDRTTEFVRVVRAGGRRPMRPNLLRWAGAAPDSRFGMNQGQRRGATEDGRGLAKVDGVTECPDSSKIFKGLRRGGTGRSYKEVESGKSSRWVVDEEECTRVPQSFTHRLSPKRLSDTSFPETWGEGESPLILSSSLVLSTFCPASLVPLLDR